SPHGGERDLPPLTVAPYFFGALGCLGVLVATANLLSAASAAALWGVAAGAAAVMARRGIAQFWGHAALYALASSIAAGLLAAAPVAITFAARSPRARELATLVTPLLLLGAMKFLFDDFGSGRAASLFITLATYGIALVVIARLRSTSPPAATLNS